MHIMLLNTLPRVERYHRIANWEREILKKCKLGERDIKKLQRGRGETNKGNKHAYCKRLELMTLSKPTSNTLLNYQFP